MKTFEDKERWERHSYLEFMAQLIEDLCRAPRELKRPCFVVRIIGRIISREFLAREVILRGLVRIHSSQYLILVFGERD